MCILYACMTYNTSNLFPLNECTRCSRSCTTSRNYNAQASNMFPANECHLSADDSATTGLHNLRFIGNRDHVMMSRELFNVQRRF